jgi:hypothetical protein
VAVVAEGRKIAVALLLQMSYWSLAADQVCRKNCSDLLAGEMAAGVQEIH